VSVRRVLVLTAVAAERDAVLRGLNLPPAPVVHDASERGDAIVVVAVGVGPAAAAARAAWLLGLAARDDPFDLVISAGIAGGFEGRTEVGATVLARRSVAADLGADSPEGFLSLTDLGFGSSTVDADGDLLDRLRTGLPEAVVGDVLTVSTVTGTRERATELVKRHPDAVAEAMEGFGIALAARQANAAFAELRTISNPVGPRDRAAWRLPEALAALERAAATLTDLDAG
jgi:futalosine hydrolase